MGSSPDEQETEQAQDRKRTHFLKELGIAGKQNDPTEYFQGNPFVQEMLSGKGFVRDMLSDNAAVRGMLSIPGGLSVLVKWVLKDKSCCDKKQEKGLLEVMQAHCKEETVSPQDKSAAAMVKKACAERRIEYVIEMKPFDSSSFGSDLDSHPKNGESREGSSPGS